MRAGVISLAQQQLIVDFEFLWIKLFPLWFFSSVNDNEDDGTADFRECIRVLSDKVGVLSVLELLDRYSKAETANEQLKKELDEKKELINALYIKHQLEKQVSL